MSFEYLSGEHLAMYVPEACTDLCLFATYEPESCDTFSDNSIKYVTSLSRCFERVLVLTNRRGLASDLHTLLPPNAAVVMLENQCHDFGLWFRVLRHLDVSRMRRIALINDSCQVLNPAALEKLIRATSSPFWGMTDSFESGIHHLQSYFLVFEGSSAIRTLQEFVRSSKIHTYLGKNKAEIVWNFEVGLSKHFVQQGITLDAVFPFANVIFAPTTWGTLGKNPTYLLWDRLLAMGMPLLKKFRQHYPNEDVYLTSIQV